ncbi:MAG: hypothetical protein ABIJ97_02570 [Bacteroidota bacterium]
MKQIRLELNSIQMLKNRERWNLYFIIATEHFEDPTKTIIIIKPDDSFIPFRKKTDNFCSFRASGNNSEGMFLLEREIPTDYSVEILFTLMHSRASLRKFGERIGEVKELLGEKDSVIENFLSASQPQVLVVKKAIGIVGKILKNVDDRNLGVVSMSEEFDGVSTEERTNKLSSGNAEINWRWISKEI